MVTIGLGLAVLPMGASAAGAGEPGQEYTIASSAGPYSSLGTCNYWRYGVIAGGHWASECYFYQPTCPPEVGCRSGWWFDYS